jgi:hypothetical protein
MLKLKHKHYDALFQIERHLEHITLIPKNTKRLSRNIIY